MQKRSVNRRRTGKATQSFAKAIDKVLNSPALNGGFETLLFKVGKIEETQDQLVVKVDEVHGAIYHQDEGLFARIKSMEVDEVKRNSELKEELHASDDELAKRVDDHANKLQDFLSWKDKVSNAFKWTLVTLLGSVVTLAFKLLYDFITK